MIRKATEIESCYTWRTIFGYLGECLEVCESAGIFVCQDGTKYRFNDRDIEIEELRLYIEPMQLDLGLIEANKIPVLLEIINRCIQLQEIQEFYDLEEIFVLARKIHSLDLLEMNKGKDILSSININ